MNQDVINHDYWKKISIIIFWFDRNQHFHYPDVIRPMDRQLILD